MLRLRGLTIFFLIGAATLFYYPTSVTSMSDLLPSSGLSSLISFVSLGGVTFLTNLYALPCFVTAF